MLPHRTKKTALQQHPPQRNTATMGQSITHMEEEEEEEEEEAPFAVALERSSRRAEAHTMRSSVSSSSAVVCASPQRQRPSVSSSEKARKPAPLTVTRTPPLEAPSSGAMPLKAGGG